ncbi:adenylate cyclase [Candidatus Nitrosopumilus koreensis AR1]|uniref:Adenylate cyclase n=1 Tax=Candidatus Nitrosopumilus koreensis AR1 TaxID=1229908 RepID=K0B6F2_9ARCH|nr:MULTISPECIES: adenylate/guanylate cyclase domain-containing protein [Nitrosopumilus]AFS81054.1 adenylate cyclase [Candidatus Nitrosopumilus koreensis AR1]
MRWEAGVNLSELLSNDGVVQNLEPPPYSILKYPLRETDSDPMGISDYLVAFATKSRAYCVGCVDMVNSTRISASLSRDNLMKYYETFLNSMAVIVGKFDGKVIKNVGDCLLFYFPLSENGNNLEHVRRSIDCGLVMTKAQKIISRELILKKLPSLNYRISMDYGSVIIMNTNKSVEIDMIGPPVNMCTKINHLAQNNEFVIGGDLREIVKKIEKYSFKQIRGYNVGFKSAYPAYKVQLKNR